MDVCGKECLQPSCHRDIHFLVLQKIKGDTNMFTMLSKREAIFGLGILAAFGALGVEVIKKQPTKEERIKLLKKEIKHFEAHLEKLNNGELPDHLKERRLSKELNEKIRLQMINATETYLRNLRFTLKASER